MPSACGKLLVSLSRLMIQMHFDFTISVDFCATSRRYYFRRKNFNLCAHFLIIDHVCTVFSADYEGKYER